MRILVAMSGGVDSSVAAGLLHEAGHEVVGATLQLYDHGAATSRKGACCAGQDIHDARDVADRLGIPHYVLDREARFRAAVIDDFAGSYAKGETPIPCVRCNQTVKFQDLVELARDLGCDSLATGHYAQRVDGPEGPELRRAADPARDQSYFLFATTREQLAFTRFPLGAMRDKAAVRAEAARLGLAVAEKPDSQDICFVPSGRYHETVAKLRPETAEPGEIVHLDGRVLGRHAGLGRYTVGQGRGLGEASRDGEEPMFVAALDAPRRRVVVGPRSALPQVEAVAGEVNWLIDPPCGRFAAQGKFRAREVPQPLTAQWDAAAGLLRVVPDTPVVTAPGQALVLYDGERVLGGGFLRRANVARGGVDSQGVAA
ncbi:tRNA 2-thiouridine(34) synthase MnmA [Roseomonas sp. OT10]|uniref:tRNA 2-thiouridine(34) synthase MnmA n=1 Tax=Roseomonas cutis TaxID=2897332 RepID=UPI001E49E708|nr:tRNA 2-thiouridine(34) synthase MnmA [Roseomonas sp. OT10]UFN49435.1 tRNA 2-thiouridine(34) synthase MnmA [Roseomonas sp. OT10]